MGKDRLFMKCKWCGKEFIKTHNRQVYCSSECRRYANLELTNRRVRRYRSKYNTVKSDQYWGLGSGNLSCHANTDFSKEYRIIQRERNRLKV